jgi:pyruvate/2-oxoglutarate dehydrogenase complex dihydrolipoamide dehydrogenase (E3) component
MLAASACQHCTHCFCSRSSAGKKGEVVVNEYSQTSVPSIWAVGDVTDRINLTPVALMEGMALAKTLALNEPTKPDYDFVPSAVFSNPSIATVVSARVAWRASVL